MGGEGAARVTCRAGRAMARHAVTCRLRKAYVETRLEKVAESNDGARGSISIRSLREGREGQSFVPPGLVARMGRRIG